MAKEKALTWDDLAFEYDKYSFSGRRARTLPLEKVYKWAVEQTDKFYIKDDYIYKKDE
jgi:hypothetical protein